MLWNEVQSPRVKKERVAYVGRKVGVFSVEGTRTMFQGRHAVSVMTHKACGNSGGDPTADKKRATNRRNQQTVQQDARYAGLHTNGTSRGVLIRLNPFTCVTWTVLDRLV